MNSLRTFPAAPGRNPRVALAAAAAVALGALSLLGIPAAGAAAPQAKAQAPAASTMTTSVGYADLDLDSAAGARALLRRLHGAAVQVCGAPDSRSLRERREFRTCVAAALAGAVARVDRPVVSQIWLAEGGLQLGKGETAYAALALPRA